MTTAGSAVRASAETATITISAFDGARQPWNRPQALYTVTDGNGQNHLRNFYDQAVVTVTDLPVFNNAGDSYTTLVSAAGFVDAGYFPVKVAAGAHRRVSLLLLPKKGTVNFAAARWTDLPENWRRILPDEKQYTDLFDFHNGLVSACLLNLFTSMQQIQLSSGSPLNFLKAVIWDRTGARQIAQDRFFGWADPKLIDQLELARKAGTFVDAPAGLHPGATRSYKQVQFGEANLQLTFHENDGDGAGNVLVEPDIDYYRDPLAHILLEVLVNAFGSLTDPRQVMALRWMAAQQTEAPEFDPLFTVQSA